MTDLSAAAGTRYYYSHREYDILLAQDPIVTPMRRHTTRAVSYEDTQAREWLADVLGNTRRTRWAAGDHVAKALARLCYDDSQVTITWAKLVDHVGGQTWFTQNGVDFLIKSGWLRKKTVGKGRGASTTFFLMPGDLVANAALDEDRATAA